MFIFVHFPPSPPLPPPPPSPLVLLHVYSERLRPPAFVHTLQDQFILAVLSQKLQ